VTGQAQPGEVSQNVFVIDTQTGNLLQVTDFQDIISPDSTASTIFFPLWKAFSRDGQRIAVSTWVHNQTTNGHTDVPLLRIYGLDGTLQATVIIGGDTIDLLQGNGVAWSPVEDVLVYPFAAETITQGLGNPFPDVTALYLAAPAQDIATTGQYKQLTFPSAFQDFTSLFWELDYAPAISPDGRRIAYVRTLTGIIGAAFQFATPSIRVINRDGTGDHQIVQFSKGSAITHISWSPDGSQLVFDLGQQATTPEGFPEFVPNDFTMMLYTIGADGSNLQPLQQAPALYPSWNPAGLGNRP
jgi:hypothetical protein